MRGPPPMPSLRWLTSSWRRLAHSPERSFCANAAVPASVAKTKTSADVLTLDRTSIHVNPSDVHEAAPPVSASRHQIREADFVDLAQVRLLDPAADLRRFLPVGVDRRHRIDVELQPANRRD